MRLLLFFDLPTETAKNRRDYARFHKFLIKNGFIMMQKSVYSKLVVNNVMSDAVRQRVSKNTPDAGVIEILEITENQFSRIEYLLGEKTSAVEDSMERYVEI